MGRKLEFVIGKEYGFFGIESEKKLYFKKVDEGKVIVDSKSKGLFKRVKTIEWRVGTEKLISDLDPITTLKLLEIKKGTIIVEISVRENAYNKILISGPHQRALLSTLDGLV